MSKNKQDSDATIDYDTLKAELDELVASVASNPDFNEAKIAFLKEEIASGRYQVQDDVIADKMSTDSEQTTKKPKTPEIV